MKVLLFSSLHKTLISIALTKIHSYCCQFSEKFVSQSNEYGFLIIFFLNNLLLHNSSFILLLNLHTIVYVRHIKKGKCFNEKVRNNLWPETFALIVYEYFLQFSEAISLQCTLELMSTVDCD